MMMMSVASFQAVEDKASLQEPSLFFQAFIQVASTLELVYKFKDQESDALQAEIQYVQMFRKSVDFYLQVLNDNQVSDRKLQEFLRKVNAEIAHVG